MKRTYDRLQGMDLMHPHKPEDITGLADLLKGFIGSLDVSSGTEDNPFPPPQIETSGFWMISIAGFIDIDSSSVEFEPGDLLVYDLSENSYSRVPSIKELPVGENPGNVLFWDGTKWDSYTKFLLQEDTLVITNNDTFKFIISGDNAGDFIEFNDDIGGVWMRTDLYLTNGGIWISGVPDDPEGYFKIIEPIVSNDRPGANILGIEKLKFRNTEENVADLEFSPFGPGRFGLIGNNWGVTYFVFEDSNSDAFVALGSDLKIIDAADGESARDFIERISDSHDDTLVNIHRVNKLYLWDPVDEGGEGYISLGDSEFAFMNANNTPSTLAAGTGSFQNKVTAPWFCITNWIQFIKQNEAAEFAFELMDDNKLALRGVNSTIQYFLFEDGDGWMALGTDLMCTDINDLEIQFPFIQRVLDGGDTTRVDLHNIYKLHFWDEVNQAEGYLKLADGDYYLFKNNDDFGNLYCEYLMAYSSVSSLGITSTKDLFFKFHSQASAPTNEQLSPNAVCLWQQTGTNKTYLCLNTGGGIRKVELI